MQRAAEGHTGIQRGAYRAWRGVQRGMEGCREEHRGAQIRTWMGTEGLGGSWREVQRDTEGHGEGCGEV